MPSFYDISPATIHRNIENATRARNPMESIKDDLHYTSPNGREYKFICRTKADMDTKTLKWAFKLAERNVSPYYMELQMGWQPKVKQNDLNKNWARYLVALDRNSTPVAYAMFRFDLDYGHCVLYCYELQIEESARRQGLGKFMMSTLESCGRAWKMEKVVLTVLKNNTSGVSFFTAIGYITDLSSPTVKEKAEYDILSKGLL